jgi:Tol biopolymer transport system component
MPAQRKPARTVAAAPVKPARRTAGLILIALGALLLVVVAAWAFLLSRPQTEISGRFITTPAQGPVEAAAPLSVEVNLDLRAGQGSGTRLAPIVNLQLRDAAGQPAPFGPGPMAYLPMNISGKVTRWVADLSAPTVPGTYHMHILARVAGQPDMEFDLRDPALQVVAATPFQGGLVYSRNGNLWRSDAQGGHARRLTYYTDDGRADSPAWSPDGKRIAYTRTLPAPSSDIPNTEIWSIDPDGGSPQVLAARRPGEDLITPAFGPDGALYFTSDRTVDPDTNATPTMDRLTAGVESWSVERLAPAAPDGSRGTVLPAARMPDVSHDGTQIVYISAPDAAAESESFITHTLMLADSDGQNARPLFPPDLYQDVLAPRFSPDGTQVAFAAVTPLEVPSGEFDLLRALGLAPLPARANGVPWDIYLAPVAGGQITRLTRLNADQPVVAWSNDGKRLALLDEKGLFMLDLADPAALHQVGPPSSHGQLDWYDR